MVFNCFPRVRFSWTSSLNLANHWNYCYHYVKKALWLVPGLMFCPCMADTSYYSFRYFLCYVHHMQYIITVFCNYVWHWRECSITTSCLSGVFCADMQIRSRNQTGTLWTSLVGYWVGHSGDLCSVSTL